MRLYACSDIHTDFDENLKWVKDLPLDDYEGTAVIVAGDVSDDLARLEKTLLLFTERYEHVFFTPGNHELWVRKGGHADSVQKLKAVLALCDTLGVHTSPQGIPSSQRPCPSGRH